jgi:PST family polysaccharide transporter
MISIPMALAGYEIWALVAQALVFSIVNSVVIWIRTPWRPSFEFDCTVAKSLTSFSVKILLSNLVGFTRNRSDQLLIGLLAGPAALGLFSLGRKLNETLDSFVKAPIDRVVVSAFSRIQGDAERLKRAVRRVSSLNALFSIPVFLGLAMVSYEAIPIAFGPNWENAVVVCSILACHRLISSLFFFNYHILISQGFPGTQTAMQFAQAIGVIAATLIAYPWGIETIAAGIAVSNLIISVATTFVASRRAQITSSSMFSPLLKPLLAGAAMAAAVWLTRTALSDWELPAALRLAAFVATGGLSYLAAIRIASKELTQEAFETLKKITRRGKAKQPKGSPIEAPTV